MFIGVIMTFSVTSQGLGAGSPTSISALAPPCQAPLIPGGSPQHQVRAEGPDRPPGRGPSGPRSNPSAQDCHLRPPAPS
eukprot:6268010-Alexandrium_andersonii.AAC.1